MAGLSDALPRALRLLREHAQKGVLAERAGWETGEATPSATELAAWLETAGYDFRDLQEALETAHALEQGAAAEPDPIEAFWVTGQKRLEADPLFRQEVRALAEAAGLQEVTRRLDRLEERLDEGERGEKGEE